MSSSDTALEFLGRLSQRIEDEGPDTGVPAVYMLAVMGVVRRWLVEAEELPSLTARAVRAEAALEIIDAMIMSRLGPE